MLNVGLLLCEVVVREVVVEPNNAEATDADPAGVGSRNIQVRSLNSAMRSIRGLGEPADVPAAAVKMSLPMLLI